MPTDKSTTTWGKQFKTQKAYKSENQRNQDLLTHWTGAFPQVNTHVYILNVHISLYIWRTDM